MNSTFDKALEGKGTSHMFNPRQDNEQSLIVFKLEDVLSAKNKAKEEIEREMGMLQAISSVDCCDVLEKAKQIVKEKL